MVKRDGLTIQNITWVIYQKQEEPETLYILSTNKHLEIIHVYILESVK